MKRMAFAVGLVVLVFAVSTWAQTAAPAPKLGPEQKKLEMWVGLWHYTAEYKPGPWGPGGQATGDYTARLVLNGYFIHGTWVEKSAAGLSRGFETFGYNQVAKAYAQSQYTDDGGMAWGTLTVEGNVWNYSGSMFMAGKEYKIKNTLTFAADLKSIALKAEVSADGKSWLPFMDFTFTKAEPAPKK